MQYHHRMRFPQNQKNPINVQNGFDFEKIPITNNETLGEIYFTNIHFYDNPVVFVFTSSLLISRMLLIHKFASQTNQKFQINFFWRRLRFVCQRKGLVLKLEIHITSTLVKNEINSCKDAHPSAKSDIVALILLFEEC